jgi:hypothetical protein
MAVPRKAIDIASKGMGIPGESLAGLMRSFGRMPFYSIYLANLQS